MSFSGSVHVGVYAAVSNEWLLYQPSLEEDLVEAITEELGVTAVPTTIGGAGTVGSLATLNAGGIVLSSQVTAAERDHLAEVTGLPVSVLPGSINAAGNVVLANDSGAYIHPELSDDAATTIEETLDVPVERGGIAGVQTVGTAAAVTNTGVLCHPKATDSELDRLADHLDVYADIGTINYGGPLIGAGLIANDAGYIAGDETTGPELGRIEETLGYLE